MDVKVAGVILDESSQLVLLLSTEWEGGSAKFAFNVLNKDFLFSQKASWEFKNYIRTKTENKLLDWSNEYVIKFLERFAEELSEELNESIIEI